MLWGIKITGELTLAQPESEVWRDSSWFVDSVKICCFVMCVSHGAKVEK